MDQRSNVMGTVSLVCGILLIVAYFLGFCLGMIPFVSLFALLLFPLEWILAIAGLVTGVIGFTTSRTMDGIGAPQSIIGALISGGWMLFQFVLFGLILLVLGSAVFLGMIGALAGNH